MTSSPEGEGGVGQKMTNDDMMREGGQKMKKETLLKLSMMIFLGGGGNIEGVPTKKITLYVWYYAPKERILTLRVVPDCKGPSTIVRNPTYAVLSRGQYCRELRSQGGGSQKVTNDDTLLFQCPANQMSFSFDETWNLKH